jgi:signal transduction histidine kinase
LLLAELPPAERPRRAEVIKRCARDMDRLIEDLLDVSRIHAGTFAVRHAPVSLCTLLAEVADAFVGRARAHGVALEIETPHASEAIEGDHQRLAQALSNLLRNAIAFTPHGGRVSLGVRPEPSHVELVVSDTGCGIEPAHLPAIFDQFWQADRTSGGAGLGLAIVKGIVEAHCGAVTVDSAPGRGTTFRLRLPRNASANQL